MGKVISGLLIIAAFFAVLIGIVYGYIANIVSLATNQAESFGMIIGRVIGIFVAPVGILLGYF